MSAKSQKKSYFNYALLYFSYFFALAVFGSILSIYLAGNGKSDTEISFIVSASGLFTMLFQPSAGYLYDRSQRDRTVSIVLLLLSGVTGVLFAATQSNVFLFLLNGFSISFLNSVDPVCERLATATPYRYGLIRIWGAVGYAVATQTAGFVYEHISPTFHFYLFGGVILLTALAFQLTAEDKAVTEKTGGIQTSKDEPIFRELLRNRAYLLFVFIGFLFGGAARANNVYISLLLQDLLGSTTRVGTLLFLGTLMEIPIILLSNKYMDQLSGKTLMTLDFVLLIIQFSTYSFVKNAAVIGVVLFFLKAPATMLNIMVNLKVVLSLVDQHCSTTALSLATTSRSIGGIVIPIGAGLVSDRFGRSAVFLLLLAIAVVGLLLSQFLRVPKDGKKLF